MEVDPADPAFQHPTKPIGSFMTREEAEALAAQGFAVMEDAGRGYRRVVASPRPKAIVELETIRALMEAGQVVVACGGGGIPVSRAEDGSLHGAEAVIDKDFAAELLAESLDADLLIILTAVEQVAIHFRQPDEAWLSELTPEEAEAYIAAGEFAPGSMLPKVEAAVRFARSAPAGPPSSPSCKKPGPASPEKPARGCGKRNPTWQPYAGKQEGSCFPAYGCPL